MADDRSLSELLWDYTVYAPIGLAVAIAEELPKLSEKGRESMAGRLQVARIVGKFTVGEAQRRAGWLFGDGSRPASADATAAQEEGGPVPSSAHAPAPRPARGRSAGPTQDSDAPGRDRGGAHGSSVMSGAAHRTPGSSNGSRASDFSTADEAEPSTARVTSPASHPGHVGPAPVAASLAIPGYDTLAASQVVQRLSSLRSDELDAIRRYEIATRGRRTILHRIAQLAADR